MIYSACAVFQVKKREKGNDRIFLLSNGEIVEQEGGPTGNPRDWKDIPRGDRRLQVFCGIDNPGCYQGDQECGFYAMRNSLLGKRAVPA